MDSELATAQERHNAELQEMWRAENEVWTVWTVWMVTNVKVQYSAEFSDEANCEVLFFLTMSSVVLGPGC